MTATFLFLTISLSIFSLSNANSPKFELLQLAEWPIYMKDNDYFFNLTVGNPHQIIPVSLHYFHTDHELQIVSKIRKGDYDETKSQFFASDIDAFDHMGHKLGKWSIESFWIGSKELWDITFIWQATSYFDFNAQIGFGMHTLYPGHGFWLDLSKKLTKPTITIAFDGNMKTGAISIGDLDQKRCHNDWRILKQAYFKVSKDADYYWGVNIEKISVGGFDIPQPGNLTFHLDDNPLVWPKSVYDKLLVALGSKDNRTVPCNSKMTIDFKLKDIVLNLTPDEYLDKSQSESSSSWLGIKKQDGCLLSGKVDEQISSFKMPRSFFRRHCLSIDNKSKEIGIATNRNWKGSKKCFDTNFKCFQMDVKKMCSNKVYGKMIQEVCKNTCSCL